MMLKRANVCWPMVFDGGFRFREADAETDGKCHRGQACRARQEPDALRFEREIRVFPALAQTYTKKDSGHDLDACLGESVGFVVCSASGTEQITLSRQGDSLAGTKWKTKSRPLPARGRFERLFEKQKDFQVWRGESGHY